jgi:probable addiction module antidote protein
MLRTVPNQLQNAELVAYVEREFAKGDPQAVLVALRRVVGAVGGMGSLAERTGLSRETLYRTLSPRGNPRLDTLAAIVAALGLRLSVRSARPHP